MTSLRYEGKPVWIGQISRDIGVRFTKKTITTHKIDPDVDETREYLLEDLAYSQSLKAFGYVPGVGEAPFDEPRGNLTGDPYFTDGLRIVLFHSSEPEVAGGHAYVACSGSTSSRKAGDAQPAPPMASASITNRLTH